MSQTIYEEVAAELAAVIDTKRAAAIADILRERFGPALSAGVTLAGHETRRGSEEYYEARRLLLALKPRLGGDK